MKRNLFQICFGAAMILFVLAPSIAAPIEVKAQAGAAAACTITAVKAAAGRLVGEAKKAAYIAASEAARLASLSWTVPTDDIAALASEAGAPPEEQAEEEGSYFGVMWDNFKEDCLDKIASALAKIVLRQMRNMVINWINQGNFGASGTFVKNFEFDAKQTAQNAAKIFASQITGIDFCNYFPESFRTDITGILNTRAALECVVDKPRPEFLAELHNPLGIDIGDRILYDLPQNDPLEVELRARERLSTQVAKAQEARKTQVTAGSGFIGIEKCKTESVIQEARYYHPGTGETCDVGEDGSVPQGCQYQAPIKECREKETVTPGKFVADMATEPLKSEFRQNELVDEVYEAIAAIVDAFVGKVINEGLQKSFGN